MQEVVVCPNCRAKLGIPENTAGQLIQCPTCDTVFSGGQGVRAAPPEVRTAGKRGAASERRASAPGKAKLLAWIMAYVAASILGGGGGFLIWILTHGAANKDETKSQEVKRLLPIVDPNKDSIVTSFRKADLQADSKQLDPAKVEPDKNDDNKGVPKTALPKTAEENKDGPANIKAKQAEPLKDEIVIGDDGWFEIHCVRGGFRVSLPAIPSFQLLAETPVHEPGLEYTAKHPAADLVFRAGMVQMRGADSTVPPTAPLRSLIKRQFPDVLFELKSERKITHEGLRGVEFLAVGFNNLKVAGRHFRVDTHAGKSRDYYFMVAGPAASLLMPDVRRFLQTVKLDKGEILLGEEEAPRPAGAKPAETPDAKGALVNADKEPGAKSAASKSAETKAAEFKKSAAPERAAPRMAGAVGKMAGKLKAHLGAVIDLEAKSALLILAGGQAKLYDYPDFRPLGIYKLGAGTAYQPIYDRARGRLFALSPSVKANDPPGKAGGSQVVLYEIRALLEGKLSSNSELAPVRIIQLGAFCSHLCLSPDGESLFALESSNPKAIKLVRVSVAKGAIEATLPLPDFTDGLTMARAGKDLYALGHLAPGPDQKPLPQGAILVIDPRALKLTKTVAVPVDPFMMAVTKEGMVYVSGRGGVRGEILVVNTKMDGRKDGAVVAIWKGVPTGSSLKLSDDEGSLFVGKWKGAPALVACLAVPSMVEGSELPAVEWTQYPPVPGHGEMIITPDNQYLLCDSGLVFFLKAE